MGAGKDAGAAGGAACGASLTAGAAFGGGVAAGVCCATVGGAAAGVACAAGVGCAACGGAAPCACAVASGASVQASTSSGVKRRHMTAAAPGLSPPGVCQMSCAPGVLTRRRPETIPDSGAAPRTARSRPRSTGSGCGPVRWSGCPTRGRGAARSSSCGSPTDSLPNTSASPGCRSASRYERVACELKKCRRTSRVAGAELREARVHVHAHQVPVVDAGALQRAIVDRESRAARSGAAGSRSQRRCVRPSRCWAGSPARPARRETGSAADGSGASVRSARARYRSKARRDVLAPGGKPQCCWNRSVDLACARVPLGPARRLRGVRALHRAACRARR